MEFQILGPLEVFDHGRRLALGGSKQRALLALLLLHANRVVSRNRLIDELWDTAPPETARTALQVHVSQLRKALGRDAIVTRAPGYMLRIRPGELDLERFEQSVEAARGEQAAGAAEVLREALRLWRGPALADLDASFARAERAQLEEQRLEALEQRIDAELELGLHAQLVPELEGLVQEDPLRERRRAQLMLALYRCGRQAEALAVYQKGRRLLSDELGLEPGDDLKRLEKAILEQDPSLAPAEVKLAGRAAEAVDDRRPRLLRRPRLAVAAGALLLAGALAATLVALTRSGGAVPVQANSVAVLDPHTGKVEADVPIGGHPLSIALGAGSVWVANGDNQTISRIDPESKKIATTIGGLGTDVSDLAFGFGSLWVAGGNDGTLARIDPRDNGARPIDVAKAGELTPQPVFLVATGAGSVWITRGNQVLRINPETNEVTGKIDVFRPQGLAAGLGSAWATTVNEHVLRIDAGLAEATADEDLSQQMIFPLVSNGSLWVIVGAEVPLIWRLNSGTLAQDAVIPFTKQFPVDLASGEGALWTVDADAGAVWRIDPGTNKAKRVATVAHHPLAVAAGEGAVWVGVQAEPFS